jgi:hypothetical protein
MVEDLSRRGVVVPVVSAPFLSTGPGQSPSPDPVQDRSAGTPLYDALVDEYRLALRTVPGDHVADEHLVNPRVPAVEFSFTPIARQSPVGFPRQVSRHRGTPEDEPTDGRADGRY